MPILDEIDRLCKEGRVIKVAQTYPGLREKRIFYATPDLGSLLDGPWDDIKWEKRWYRARQFLDDFIDGNRLTLRSAPRKKSSCDMSLLDPEANEIWEMRCRDPKPGLRIFGSFVKTDIFVALTCTPHECLRNEVDWNNTIYHYKAEWARYFSHSAFTGYYPYGYLTNAIILD